MLKIKPLKSTKNELNFDALYAEFHSKAINEIHNLPEYQQNLMQIETIKKVLINNADVPEKLVVWLIESIKNNTVLEYTATNKKFFDYLK